MPKKSPIELQTIVINRIVSLDKAKKFASDITRKTHPKKK